MKKYKMNLGYNEQSVKTTIFWSQMTIYNNN